MDTQSLKFLNSKIKSKTPSKTNGGEWIMVTLALAFVDGAQIILDFVAVGVAINRFVDIVIAVTFALYLFFRGELADPDTRLRIIAILIISFAAEEVPILDAAPFWTGDALYFWHLANKRTAAAQTQTEAQKKVTKVQTIENQRERMARIQEMRERQQLQSEVNDEGIGDEGEEDLYEDAP